MRREYPHPQVTIEDLESIVSFQARSGVEPLPKMTLMLSKCDRTPLVDRGADRVGCYKVCVVPELSK